MFVLELDEDGMLPVTVIEMLFVYTAYMAVAIVTAAHKYKNYISSRRTVTLYLVPGYRVDL